MFANYHVKNIAAHFHQKPVESSWICLQYFEQISAFGGFSAESARGTLHLVHVRSVPHHHYILTRHAPRVLCVKHDVRLMIHTDFDTYRAFIWDFLGIQQNCFFSGQLPSVSTTNKTFHSLSAVTQTFAWDVRMTLFVFDTRWKSVFLYSFKHLLFYITL